MTVMGVAGLIFVLACIPLFYVIEKKICEYEKKTARP